tara:strand:- start:67 stop:504 length:438 start_codon:yes stop_codon:yes gene_type:complete
VDIIIHSTRTWRQTALIRGARGLALLVLLVCLAGCAAVAYEPIPVLVRGSAPVYPVEASAQGIEAEVDVHYVITSAGQVRDVSIIKVRWLSGEQQLSRLELDALAKSFERAAALAVQSWRFQVAKGKDGVRRAQETKSTLTFLTE